MIVFDLQCGEASCAGGASFEAWFRSSADYEEQRAGGLVQCPFCQSAKVSKAPMAPRLPSKGANPLAQLAEIQAEMLKDSRWVGDKFADTARAMHSGEIDREQVHGQATLEQAKSLAEDGVPVAPLPIPIVPPDQVN
jgi:hypothetical protein